MAKSKLPVQIDSRIESLLQGRLHDPLMFLGPHFENGRVVIRVFQPYAIDISVVTSNGSETMQRIHPAGVFEWTGMDQPAHPYQLRVTENTPELPTAWID
ncbi:MAG: hypothetical protein WDM70_01755 [Nitrosomonadales bacterium]